MEAGIFVDTSAWYSLADAADVNHVLARGFLPKAMAGYRELVSTNHVIGEAYTLIRYRLGHEAAWQFLRSIGRSRRLRLVFLSEEMERKAYALLERYPDQAFSFVDGTSFVAMKDQELSSCFAFDRHFRTAGFTTLPVSSASGGYPRIPSL